MIKSPVNESEIFANMESKRLTDKQTKLTERIAKALERIADALEKKSK